MQSVTLMDWGIVEFLMVDRRQITRGGISLYLQITITVGVFMCRSERVLDSTPAAFRRIYLIHLIYLLSIQ
jgi:hypothetical protein